MLARPPCSRSITTTASLIMIPDQTKQILMYVNKIVRQLHNTISVLMIPEARRSATVSKILDPDVMISSTIKHESSCLNTPSINFFVPYALASLRRINMDTFCFTEMMVAIGRAVYGTPQIRSYFTLFSATELANTSESSS